MPVQELEACNEEIASLEQRKQDFIQSGEPRGEDLNRRSLKGVP